jgi:hypothetical protein
MMRDLAFASLILGTLFMVIGVVFFKIVIVGAIFLLMVGVITLTQTERLQK